MRPGPAEELSLTGVSDTALELRYSVSPMMRGFPPGLIMGVRVTNMHEPGVWQELDMARVMETDKEV